MLASTGGDLGGLGGQSSLNLRLGNGETAMLTSPNISWKYFISLEMFTSYV